MRLWQNLRTLPRELWILSTATLINRSGTMVLPFLALYLNKYLHYTIAEAGLALTIYGIAALVTAPLVGKLCDIISPLKVMKFSLLLSGILLFAFPFITNYWGIMGLTFVWSMLNESFRPANLVLISAYSAPEQRRIAFSLNRMAINLGMSIGPAVGGFLFVYDYSLIFYIDGAAHILSFIFLAVSALKMEIRKNETGNIAGSSISAIEVKERRRRLIFFLLGMIPLFIAFFQMLSTYPLYLSNGLKLPESVYGLLFSLNTVMIIFIEVPLLNALASRSHIGLMRAGAVLIAVGFGAMAVTKTIPLLLATVVIWTFGEMIVFPTSAAYISELAPPEKRGQFMGYYQTANNIAFSLGPWLGTEVYEYAGSNYLWGGAFVLGILSAVLISYKVKGIKK